jgi:hypothetical protein
LTEAPLSIAIGCTCAISRRSNREKEQGTISPYQGISFPNKARKATLPNLFFVVLSRKRLQPPTISQKPIEARSRVELSMSYDSLELVTHGDNPYPPQCNCTVSAQPVGSTTVTGFTYTDSGCTNTAGAVGVRTYNSAAKWRDISVSSGGTSTLPYYAPFAASSGPAGYSTYAGSWSLSSENYIDSTTDTQGDKSTETNSFGNFTLTGDVDATTTGGNTGFLFRASAPAVGADSVDGYYAAWTARETSSSERRVMASRC